MSQVITLNRSNFDAEVLDTDQPVLVDYRADWCGPCRAIEPILEAIAAERAGHLRVGKVDVDEEPELAQLAGAFSIPYLLLYRDGAAVARVVGALPKAKLEAALGLDGEPVVTEERR
jgi:thioredoxin 1